ncbi:hypothetical protein EPHNCH_0249 [Anaplasma phagocytophilum str. NCH-1]|uniref:Uncharacterized protein n=1 Tax=Anaplasma phagocytophilum str. NCH-1 TaxID=1359161 RepID=A0A0F3NMX7_ANAPH|nr:hypothetical protein EPHNCH_0249 [Anaplasma phagocytophilum str. NCH-1]
MADFMSNGSPAALHKKRFFLHVDLLHLMSALDIGTPLVPPS